ncbi:MAG: E3 ubiquitin protein ligase [Candidatus Heimdallarchaeota archaeon]|nr:E3 ubiquitin protein ligase [Candidatus Heimdallarchaeota archaeon]
MNRNKRLFIFALNGFFVFILGIVLKSFYTDNFYPFIPIIIGVLVIFLTAVIYRFSKKSKVPIGVDQAPYSSEEYHLKADEIYRQRVEDAIQIALGKRNDLPTQGNILAVEYHGIIKNDICMICKLFLTSKDSILQCPTCESLYHKEHLYTWITSKQRCPVCSKELYHKENKK